MNDTSDQVRRMVRELYQDMSPQQRFRIGASMFDTARAMVLASLPDTLSPHERRKALCRRFYGDLADQVYG